MAIPLNIYKVTPEISESRRPYVMFWHIVAPTPGAAWYEWMSYLYEGYEFTDKRRIRLLAKNVDLPRGVDENYAWAESVGMKIHIWEYDDDD